ncbi:MAG: hypothetical protein VB996_17325 [Pseudomonadales bacterium]
MKGDKLVFRGMLLFQLINEHSHKAATLIDDTQVIDKGSQENPL